MILQAPSRTSVDADALPGVIGLERNLYCVTFPLMKLLPARFILRRAREEKLITSGSVIIETSSGTFALALARQSAIDGYDLKLAGDPAIDPLLKQRLEELGAEVHVVNKPARVGGFQRARLDLMAELQARHPDHFWPSQYDNPLNPGAYAPVAELLAEMFLDIDFVVGPVGSGGSMCGIANYLRPVFRHFRAVGIDTHNSVLFGQPDGKRLLRGLGNSLMPRNLDHTVFDEVHWVSAADAFYATRELHRRHALFRGPTSGAAFLVARWLARQNPDATVVCLMPDDGTRYQQTVYNDDWLRESGIDASSLESVPTMVTKPDEKAFGWSRMTWARRSYEQVMGAPFVPEINDE